MMTNNDKVHLLKLRARNIKCIKEVELTLDGSWHEIAGDTGEGKTSVLAAIEAGLRGMDGAAVRQGESKAEIELELSDYVIERIVNADGQDKVMVTGNDGHPVEKAREFLKAAFGPASFRPLQWVQLSSGDGKGRREGLRRQRDELLAAIPMSLSAEQVAEIVEGMGEQYRAALKEVNWDDLDFTAHGLLVCEQLERASYDARKLQNERVRQAENVLEVTPAPEMAAPSKSADELQRELKQQEEAYWGAKARQDNQQELRKRRDALAEQVAREEADLPDAAKLESTTAHYRNELDEAQAEVTRLEEALRQARERRDEASTKLEQCEAYKRRLDNHAARVQDLERLNGELANETGAEDLAAMESELEGLRAKLDARRKQDAHDQAATAAKEAKDRSEVFDELVRLFRDRLPQGLLEAAELPIPGLGVDGDAVTLDGVRVDQLGTSQQIRLGVMVAAALNPRCGFCLIDGGESLGRKDRQALAAAAKEMNLQLISTVVNPDAEPGPGRTVMSGGSALE